MAPFCPHFQGRKTTGQNCPPKSLVNNECFNHLYRLKTRVGFMHLLHRETLKSNKLSYLKVSQNLSCATNRAGRCKCCRYPYINTTQMEVPHICQQGHYSSSPPTPGSSKMVSLQKGSQEALSGQPVVEIPEYYVSLSCSFYVLI